MRLLFVLISLALCSATTQQANPGISIQSNVVNLNKWLASHLNVLSLVDQPLPDQSWSFLGVGVFTAKQLRLQNVSAEAIRVEAQPDNRLRVTVLKSTLSVHFRTRVGLVTSSGLVHFTNNSVTTVVHIDGDASGKPILVVESLNVTLGSFSLQLNLGQSLWTILNTALPLIKGWTERHIPGLVLPIVNKRIVQKLTTIGTVVPVDPAKRMAVDISFFSRPIITSSFVQFQIRGIPYVNGAPFDCPYIYARPFQGADDVAIATDAGFINCVTAAAATADIVNEFLANLTLPTPEPIALGLQLFADQTYAKFSAGTARGALSAVISLWRAKKAAGSPFLALRLTGSTDISLSFEGTNFTHAVVHAKLGRVDNSLSILSFNGDQKGISADLSLLAKQLSLLDSYVNHPFVQVVPIPFPQELNVLPIAATELFRGLSLKIVDGAFYAGIDFNV